VEFTNNIRDCAVIIRRGVLRSIRKGGASKVKLKGWAGGVRIYFTFSREGVRLHFKPIMEGFRPPSQ